MMEQTNHDHTFNYPTYARHRPRSAIAQQLGAMFAMLAAIALLLWLME